MPLTANVLPLTPISAFRPRRWHGALLPSTADVLFEVLEPHKRPVAASEDGTMQWVLLFDPDIPLAKRIITEQFRVERPTLVLLQREFDGLIGCIDCP